MAHGYDGLLGQRVIVRRRLGIIAGRAKFSDVLGDLTDAGDPLSVLTSTGATVAVPYAEIHRIKAIPPRGRRVGDVLELERIAALGWPAPDTRRLGGWLLRAADGWTGRANSTLPLGDPGRPVDQAVGVVARWYAERGLPVRFQIPVPGALRLEDWLDHAGYTTDTPVAVRTADLPTVAARIGAPVDLPAVVLDPTPSEDWLAHYHFLGGAGPPPVARVVLTGARLPVFATVREGGTTVAIGRAVVDEGWLGVTAVEVVEGHRRRRLATHVMAALVGWGRGHGARRSYLQVINGNVAAFALYDRLGYATHHWYHYRTSTVD